MACAPSGDSLRLFRWAAGFKPAGRTDVDVYVPRMTIPFSRLTWRHDTF